MSVRITQTMRRRTHISLLHPPAAPLLWEPQQLPQPHRGVLRLLRYVRRKSGPLTAARAPKGHTLRGCLNVFYSMQIITVVPPDLLPRPACGNVAPSPLGLDIHLSRITEIFSDTCIT